MFASTSSSPCPLSYNTHTNRGPTIFLSRLRACCAAREIVSTLTTVWHELERKLHSYMSRKTTQPALITHGRTLDTANRTAHILQSRPSGDYILGLAGDIILRPSLFALFCTCYHVCLDLLVAPGVLTADCGSGRAHWMGSTVLRQIEVNILECPMKITSNHGGAIATSKAKGRCIFSVCIT